MKLYIYGGVLAALVLVFGVFGWRMHHAGYVAGETAGNARVAALTAQYATATAMAEADARAKEQAGVDAMAAINAQHAQELDRAKQDADRVAAGLRAGTLRLRHEWAGCEAAAGVPQATASARKPDATAERRTADSANLVRIGAEYDAKIRAFQAIVRLDRQ
jgi:hypothetical protein